MVGFRPSPASMVVASGTLLAGLDDCCHRDKNKDGQEGEQDDPDERAWHESPRVRLGRSPRLCEPSLAIGRGAVRARVKRHQFSFWVFGMRRCGLARVGEIEALLSRAGAVEA